MISKEHTVLNRANDKPLVIDTFFDKSVTNQPVVIFCHGYKGFKDWGAWNLMAHQIAKSGFCFVKFNFSHNGGTSDQPIDFPDLEAFGANNYSKELDDLGDILNWIQDEFKTNQAVNISEIYVIGHSRGGGISILKTAEDSRIKKLVCLASVSDFGSRFGTKQDIEKWRLEGVKYVINGRTKQNMPHYFQFYEDFLANAKRLEIASAAKALNVPQLIIHGKADTSVKLDEALALHKWNPNARIELIENADHVFNIKHPWYDETVSHAFQTVIDLMVSFLKETS